MADYVSLQMFGLHPVLLRKAQTWSAAPLGVPALHFGSSRHTEGPRADLRFARILVAGGWG